MASSRALKAESTKVLKDCVKGRMLRLVIIPSLVCLAACGSNSGSSDSDQTVVEAAQIEENFFFPLPGTRAGASPSSGLGFATNDSALEDVDGAGEINVQVVRTVTDHEAGETRLVLTNEVAEFTSIFSDVASITIDGETLVFDFGSNPESVPGGQLWIVETPLTGDVSGIVNAYVYESAENPSLSGEFDSDAYFVVGFETDPAEIAALTGTATYVGEMFGYGQVVDANDGSLLDSEVEIEGEITINADFADLGTVNGGFSAEMSGGFDNRFANSVEMDFDADLDGNGYVANLNCSSGCSENASEIAGAFFGKDAIETTGVVAFDITETLEDQNAPGTFIETQFLSGAGFLAEQ